MLPLVRRVDRAAMLLRMDIKTNFSLTTYLVKVRHVRRRERGALGSGREGSPGPAQRLHDASDLCSAVVAVRKFDVRQQPGCGWAKGWVRGNIRVS